jgi:hypothetical protein
VPGIYAWKVTGEQLDPKTQQWIPLCQDRTDRVFRLRRGQLNETPVPAVTEQAIPTATLLQNAYCLRGPGTDYESLTILNRGSQVEIEGRNPDGTWWYVRVPGSSLRCWLGSKMVTTAGDVTHLPVIEPPPLGCWVHIPNTTKNECKVPCPSGAKPGGVCEP